MIPEAKQRNVLLSALLGAAVFCLFFVVPDQARAQESSAAGKRSEIERQLADLERQANEFDTILEQVGKEKRTFSNEVKDLETQVKRRELEIKRLTLAIRKAKLEIAQKADAIAELSRKIDKSRRGLSASLFLFSTYDQDNELTILLKHRNLSEFFDAINGLEKAKTYISDNLVGFKEDRVTEEKEKQELEDLKQEHEELRSLQEVERRFLAQKKKEKDELLALTQGKEALFQKLLQSKKKDIASLKTQLFYLEKTGITAEEAVRLAELAAQRAGIRPAFLLALLEVETGKQFEDGVISVGTNLGTGKWKADLYDCYVKLGRRGAAEAEKSAFFRITANLGLDPDKMPVSRRPSYGCGGAMGPAQFLPTTWLRFESKVAALTGHNPPNPWNSEDAFTASAVFLASAGADSKTNAGEIAAAKTYLSGNPSCGRAVCRYYSNRVVALAKEIDRIL